jgi:aspartyl/asparaginyl beta-hydroxylase (cupin superfamily)
LTDWQAVVSAGLNQWRGGDAKSAKEYLEQVLEDRSAPAGAWLLLSNIRASLGDAAGREQALDEALQRDGNNIAALLTKGELVAERGDDRAACSFLGLALANAPRNGGPELQQRLARAERIMVRAQQRFGEHLEQQLQQAGLADQRPSRFQEALQIMMGERSIQLQQPTSFFYPGLPQTPFHDPSDFPWIAELEKRTEAMRGEVEALLAEDGTFAPYLQSDPTRANRGHTLLDDKRWSAFYLWKDGAPVASNAARCPETMRALQNAPLPHIPERAPTALFSLLAPRTHIEPHWGMLNTRLICHIPLIVPPGCRLRVGNHERTVEAGKAILFDDSIEHEAFNDSDQTRVILLLEVWNPALSDAEREALTAMFSAIGLYGEG